jgi:hypothetical protein
MDKLIAELTKLVRFKDSTDVGDLVLIIAKEPQVMVSYALVTDIQRDDSRKNEWWHVAMTLLALPPQKITWTLRTPQMTGMEVFTMGGEQRFVKAVDLGGIRARTSGDVPGAAGEPAPREGKKASFLKRVK